MGSAESQPLDQQGIQHDVLRDTKTPAKDFKALSTHPSFPEQSSDEVVEEADPLGIFGGLRSGAEEASLEQGREEGHQTQDRAAAAGFSYLCDHHQELTAKPETINTDKRAVTIMVSVQLACQRRGEDWMVNNGQTP